MRNAFTGAIVSALLVWSPGASAQDAPQQPALRHELPTYEGPALTLSDAVDEALRQNPELIALRQQFEVARQRPGQERFLAPPTFEAQIWQWPIDTLNPVNTNMYMLMANQDVPGRGKRQLREAVSEKEAAMAQNEIAVRARDVIEQVKRAWADLYLSRKTVEIHHANLDVLRQLADVSTAKYATGRISQQDTLKAVTEISHVYGDIIEHDEQAALAQARLNTLLGRLPEGSIGPLPEPDDTPLAATSEELQRIALERHPELRGSQLGIERARAQLDVVRSDYGPDFFWTAGYMLMPRDRDAWMAKVGVTWPTAPWSRGRLDLQRAEATAAVDAAKATERVVESRLRLAVQQAYVRVKAAEQRAALIRTTIVPQTEQTFEVSRAAYQTDRLDFLALLDNERARLDAELEYYRALGDLAQAHAELERAVGGELPSVITSATVQQVGAAR